MNFYVYLILIVIFSVFGSSKKNVVHSAIKSSTIRSSSKSTPKLASCDAAYARKYGSPFGSGDSKIVRPTRVFTSSEFLSVERLPNEVFDHRFDESSEFMVHDYDVSFLTDDDFEKYFSVPIGGGTFVSPPVMVNTNNRPRAITPSRSKTQAAVSKSRMVPKKKSKVGKNLENKIEPPFYTANDTFSGFFGNSWNFDGKNSSGKTANFLRWLPGSCKNMRKIVGGWNLKSIEQLPYMAFIDSGCGGSIIGEEWVLTSAQCLTGFKPQFVYVGSLELLGGCQYGIERTRRHPRFSPRTFAADIGLIKIKPKFVYSPAIKPLKLANNPVRVTLCGIVAGWGTQRFGGVLSTRLRMTIIPVVLRNRCLDQGIQNGHFCAGYLDGNADTCQGDSGGPFVIDGLLYGLTSFGYRCGQFQSPGVYVQIFSYRSWIRRLSGI